VSDEVEIVKELSEIVPNWKYVDLTKKGYNEQYVQTLLKLAAYVTAKAEEAAKKVLDDIYRVIPATFKASKDYRERTAEEWRTEMAEVARFVADYDDEPLAALSSVEKGKKL
jgi:hypothetical protein